ncbi:MAG: hypothetical protein WCT05_05610 [Lentisphaeria bacterium]
MQTVEKQKISDSGKAALDIIIPVGLEDEPDMGKLIQNIIELHKKTGFAKFALSDPSKGWRSVGYPPKEHFLQIAEKIIAYKQALGPYGIECAWWHTLTLKSGPTPWRRIINIDGTPARFSSCPLDPDFRERFASDVALVAAKASPYMIIFEDDFGINCHNGLACFCDLHLAEFARRTGIPYSRQELQEKFAGQDEESISLRRRWAELCKDSLVGLAAHIREKVDLLTPGIPMGSMQPGCADLDGDSTQAVAAAFAGKKHRPFVRLYGSSYGSDDAPSLPETMFHALYGKQHLPENFIIYHESDTYPHNRFCMSAGKLKSLMASAYSFAFDGSTFQARQHLDDPNEEKGYYEMFVNERKRFQAIQTIAKNCAVSGCGLFYDPFRGSFCKGAHPGWLRTLAHFGIPYTTNEAQVNFLSGTQPDALSNEKIKELLCKGLILDGEAAQVLCERGFSEDLGVMVAPPVEDANKLRDLEGREMIREPFVSGNHGRRMTWNSTYSPYGNGVLFQICPLAPACKTITDLLNFREENLGSGMTRFVNRYGGRVVVMAMTTSGNLSSSLFNYRRQRLLQKLILWAGADDIVFVKERAKTFCILNQPLPQYQDRFRGVLTLINLCSDSFDSVELFLPEKWRKKNFVKYLDSEGNWEKADFQATPDGIEVFRPTPLFDPLYLLFEKAGAPD